jgi:hypothetical protein
MEATSGDLGLQRFPQQWAGYCLTGVIREHALVFIYGTGGNGHRQVKDRILEAEGAIRQWTKPKLSDPNNERVLLEFRERLRQRLERGITQAIGGTASYLIDVLRILAETKAENFNPPRQAEL